MSFYCIKLSELYKLFQTSGNFTRFGQGNQGIIREFFSALGWEPCVVDADLLNEHLNISMAIDRYKWRNAIRPVTQHISLRPTMSGTGR